MATLLAPGFHGSAWPSSVSSAANQFRGWPPIELKLPLTYTAPSLTTSDETWDPSGLGFQDFTCPVVASSAASPAR
jgi:hypothetical protein